MTLHMKGTVWGIRNLAQPNARDGETQPLCSTPFLCRDSSSTLMSAHLAQTYWGEGVLRAFLKKNINAESLMV